LIDFSLQQFSRNDIDLNLFQILSQFAPQEIIFPAYTKDEITDILTSRLSQVTFNGQSGCKFCLEGHFSFIGIP
jgi:Cdc6-like AAA superfamily ATPase